MTGQDLDLTLNGRFLVEALVPYSSQVRIGMTDKVGPVALRGRPEEGLRIVMSMRI